MKVCRRCKRLKDINEFHKCSETKDKRIAKCKQCVHEIYLLTYTPKKKRVSKCKVCGVATSDSVVLVGNYCRPCKADAVKKYTHRYKVRKQTETFDEGLFTYSECMKWIQLIKARGAWVTVSGLNDLITVYNSLGGKHQYLELMPAGEQLYNMWLFCKQKLLDE